MDNISLFQQQKVKLVSAQEKQSLEIGKSFVDSGLLKKLPGPSLSIYIYILTHLTKNNVLEININKICSLLPYELMQIKKSFDYMDKHDIIDIVKKNDLSYKIIPKTNICENNKENDILINRKVFSNFEEKINYRKKIIKKENLSLNELKKAIVSFLADNIDYRQYNEVIDSWLNDFSKEILQELIRRVDKWLKKQKGKDKENKAFYYLRGIIDDWYQKKIYDIDRLKYFDRLYRETKDLARIYGIKWRNINPTQLETFRSWLLDDFALSSSLVQYAIKEAVRRKRDGQPSLNYIENNFIKKLKENKIRSVKEAKKYFSQNKYNISKEKKDNKEKNNEKKKSEKWDRFYWDL